MEGLNNGFLNTFAAQSIDGVGDVGVQFHSAVLVLSGAIFGQLGSAVITKLGPKMIFSAAFAAMVAHFAGRHGDEKPSCALDDFDVADNEFIVERHRAKSLEPIILIGYKFNPDFADFHGLPRINLPSIAADKLAQAVVVYLQYVAATVYCMNLIISVYQAV
jgi:hypothetical protein